MLCRIFIFCLLCFLLYTPSVFASDIKINEIIIHPRSGNHEWIEFYNPEKLNLSEYFIDDDTDFTSDSGNSPKKKLSAMQATDTQYPFLDNTSSMFNNDGDWIVLFDSYGAIIDQYSYTKDPGLDTPIGRFPDGSGEFAILQAATKGMPNAPAEPSPTPSQAAVPTSTHTPTPIKNPTPTATPKP